MMYRVKNGEHRGPHSKTCKAEDEWNCEKEVCALAGIRAICKDTIEVEPKRKHYLQHAQKLETGSKYIMVFHR